MGLLSSGAGNGRIIDSWRGRGNGTTDLRLDRPLRPPSDDETLFRTATAHRPCLALRIAPTAAVHWNDGRHFPYFAVVYSYRLLKPAKKGMRGWLGAQAMGVAAGRDSRP